MSLRGIIACVVCAVSACAITGGPAGRLATEPPAAVSQAWSTLAKGDHENAGRALAAAADRGEALAAFGLAQIAYERADVERALAAYGSVWRSAAEQGGAWSPLLVAAAAIRAAQLVDELPDPNSANLDLNPKTLAALPWQARLALVRAADQAARRRGDAAASRDVARRAGCPLHVDLVGRVAALPALELDAPATASSGEPQSIEANGCRITVPPRAGTAGLPGVVELRLDVDAAGDGAREVILEHDGLAALRVDGGPWLAHGGIEDFGPRASAHHVRLSSGRHSITVRLGLYGLAAELSILVSPPAPAAPEDELPPEGALPDGLAFAYELARAAVAQATGDAWTMALLRHRLERRRGSAIALAAAGALAEADATRPGHLNRDAARTLYAAAIDRDRLAARAQRELGALELADERPREAAERAAAAVASSARWWPGHALLQDALEAQSLDLEADRALDRAIAALGGERTCAVVPRALARAVRRRDDATERRLAERASVCDARSDAQATRLRLEGNATEAAAALRRSVAVATSADWLRQDLALALLAAGNPGAAVDELKRAIAENPRDASLWLRLADAQSAAGDGAGSGATIADALRRFPGRSEVRQASRVAALPLLLDPFRLDGREVISAFERSGRRYDAPAILVLDRTVERVFPDGGRIVLTHNIVRVHSKDGIDRWGEVTVPPGADVLTLRTVKADGRVKHPEDIAGKDAVSAPDLQPGDYVEWEFVEWEEPMAAFAPGFVGERFFFRSFELPLDRSEYVVVVPRGLHLDVDARAGAPAARVEAGADGDEVHTYATGGSPQVFVERAAVPPLDWLPSVRLSSGVSLGGWSRFAADRLAPLARSTPDLQEVAARITKGVGRSDAARAAAIVRWVTDAIEGESGLDEPASFGLARGRGNRLPLATALLRAAGIQAVPVLARPRTTAEATAPLVAQELDDWSEMLLWLPRLSGGGRVVDVRLRHAPFGYVAPALDGAPALVVGAPSARTVTLRSAEADERKVTLTAQISPDGRADVTVDERVRGWPALEWSELLDRVGSDRSKLAQEFEERWLAQHFPGAQLADVAIDVIDEGQGGVSLHYRFATSTLATLSRGELTISPTFFRAQPGRRYATEPSRRTTLLLGYDVPLDLTATLQLPPGARVTDVGGRASIDVGGPGGGRFVEARTSTPPARAGRGPEVQLRRFWRLPILRVAPDRYAGVAAALRRVDPLESAVIRAQLRTR